MDDRLLQMLPCLHCLTISLGHCPGRERDEEVPEIEVRLTCVSPNAPAVVFGVRREGSLVGSEALLPRVGSLRDRGKARSKRCR